MTKRSKRNPISYLGWLGWIGVIGINTGDFLLQGFLVYFFFFLYSHVPADELFWENLRKAGFRTFTIGLIWGSIMMILIVIIERVGETPENINAIFKMGVLSFFLLLCFFIGSLMYYNHQDKKYLEEGK